MVKRNYLIKYKDNFILYLCYNHSFYFQAGVLANLSSLTAAGELCVLISRLMKRSFGVPKNMYKIGIKTGHNFHVQLETVETTMAGAGGLQRK